VKLINTDGMAFIGPGSEWFWTALSGLVLAITFLAIYRQLSMARSANAFEQLNRITNELRTELATRNRLEVMLALREGVRPENVPEGAAGFIADYWEGVAVLVRSGHVDRKLVHEYLGYVCQWWWAILAPNVYRARIDTGDVRADEGFEWLAGAMAEMDTKAGAGVQFDQAYLTRTLDRRIESAREQMRIAEELRAVIVRPISAEAPSAPPAPAAAQQAMEPAGPSG
jgi:hypothetical protein